MLDSATGLLGGESECFDYSIFGHDYGAFWGIFDVKSVVGRAFDLILGIVVLFDILLIGGMNWVRCLRYLSSWFGLKFMSIEQARTHLSYNIVRWKQVAAMTCLTVCGHSST